MSVTWTASFDGSVVGDSYLFVSYSTIYMHSSAQSCCILSSSFTDIHIPW